MTQPNTLFYGDNLPVLREHIATASVDLVYLDPPFNSSRSYNVLFKDESGRNRHRAAVARRRRAQAGAVGRHLQAGGEGGGAGQVTVGVPV